MTPSMTTSRIITLIITTLSITKLISETIFKKKISFVNLINAS